MSKFLIPKQTEEELILICKLDLKKIEELIAICDSPMATNLRKFEVLNRIYAYHRSVLYSVYCFFYSLLFFGSWIKEIGT